jgi:ribosomal-protein-alanine N-acetyltransferase
MICVTCRSVLLPDLPDVVALDHRCLGGLWSENAYRREIESPNSDLLLLEAIAPPDTRTIIGIGCSWAILEEAHITLLAIEPTYQGRGLGQWLLTSLLTAASDRGLTHATLEVRQSNQTAQALYAKFGFKVAGERRKYYADGENALILWRSGLQDPDFTKILQSHRAHLLEQLSSANMQIQEARSRCGSDS